MWRGLNAKQLYCALRCQRITEPYFDGILAHDILTDIEAPFVLIVCNTDVQGGKGEHWVLFHLIGDHMRFYDPAGADFHTYGHEFTDFVSRWSTSYEICDVRTQPPNSKLCGLYCLYFAYFSCIGRESDEIIASMKNAHVVVDFVNRKFFICPQTRCNLLLCCKRK